MADLIAQGVDSKDRWRRTLPVGQSFLLGRKALGWSTPWDARISRKHAEVCWEDGRLKVKRLDQARNAIFVQGKQCDEFELVPGEHFVIGETMFLLTDEQVNVSVDAPQPVQEQTYSAQDLRQMRYRNAEVRIDLLSRLPEIISGASSDTELFVRLVNMLLAGVPRATVTAIVKSDMVQDDTSMSDIDVAAASSSSISVLHWDRRRLSGGDFEPSQRLISETIRSGESVLHIWAADEQGASAFTMKEDVDWAFCTPVGGEVCSGWALYVSGCFSAEPTDVASGQTPTDATDLVDDLKYTELAAATLRSVLEARQLERRHAGLSQFFSPVVLEALAGQDPDVVLAAQEADVSVLFCDLRGFARESEKAADNLLDLLERTSKSLGVMTHSILDQGGVVGDFHGDAAMGFWGWPIAQPDAIERACRAALGIRAEFDVAAKQPGHRLAGFRMGIGIATGKAVAGKIGTTDQVKVTVFGPVVNLASRLETMTKILRAPILLDEPTAQYVQERIGPEVARCRRLARVLPFGMETPLEVSELVPPVSELPELTDEHLSDYEEALDAMIRGEWPEAFDLLHRVPAEDRAKDFLTVLIAQHNRTAPLDWDGVIRLENK